MFARSVALAVALLAGCAPASAQGELPAGTPLPEFFVQCDEKDGWSDPAPPIRLFANVYDVGTCGIVVLLIASDKGHVLIDSGPAEAAPLVAANIRKLGFALDDVEWIVNSHEHHDHVGGLAELQALTGARVAANAAAKRQLETLVSFETEMPLSLMPSSPPTRLRVTSGRSVHGRTWLCIWLTLPNALRILPTFTSRPPGSDVNVR